MRDPLLDRLEASERRLAEEGEDIHDHVRRQRRTAAAIAYYEQILDDVVAARHPEEIIEALLERLRLILDADCAQLLLLHGGKLAVHAAAGHPAGQQVVDGLAEHVAASGITQSTREQDLDEALRARGLRRAAGAPVLTDEGVEGVLHVADTRAQEFLGAELDLLCMVATQLGHCLERSRLMQDLEAQTEHARQASRFKTTLLHAMAHDVRTPLTALRTQCQLLEKDILLPEQRRETARRAALNAQRLCLMLDDFLDLARMDAGRFGLRLHPIDLAAAAQDVVELFGAHAHARGIRIIVETQQTPAWADAARIRQVLNNLVSNAIRYTGAGGTIAVRCRPDGEALLEVQDDGSGMTQKEIASVFDAFEQVRERGSEPVGVGLGLYLARIIVAEHGGSLTIDSPGPGAGTTVRLRLPPCMPDDVPADG